MPASKEKFLVGLVGPEALSAIEADSMHPVFLDIEACNALEIRYDFFPVKEWPKLSARLRKVAPHAMQVGTIRLKRDGGLFPDHDAYVRFPLWSEILKADSVPEWIDLEQDCLGSFRDLENIASLRKTKILVSQHNFLRIPSQQELNDFHIHSRRTLENLVRTLKEGELTKEKTKGVKNFISELSSDTDRLIQKIDAEDEKGPGRARKPPISF